MESHSYLLAVNGTLMRGLALNRNLLDAGAVFVCVSKTSPSYRLWSIEDRYPGMLRDPSVGSAIELEVWEVGPAGLFQILEKEPPGLTLGRLELEDGREVFGVLAEAYLVRGQPEITSYGGWRPYIAALEK
jgi:gamma-glutamylcyclotransferase (GGCT)/AIG2-like uncharacterized protein YtfP